MASTPEKKFDVDEHIAKSLGTKPKVFKDGQYVDPVLKSLAKINGEINKLTKNQLQLKLRELGLDSRGVKEVLRKRLKNHYKKKKVKKPKFEKTNYDYLAVIDFEATCEENNTSFRHEIIEFPIILVDVEKMEVISQFHSYVRPLVNPKLTEFCTQLTGISQETVDQSETFPVVLSKVEEFLATQQLGTEKSFAVLTDGPWDMFRFMYYQCVESDLAMPSWSKKWVNIRKAYRNFYQCGRGGIEPMLKNLGMKFEGNPHSGIDDATNIARIAIKMLKDGCALNINEHIQIIHRPNEQRPDVRYEPVNHYPEGDSDEDASGEIVFEDEDEEEADKIGQGHSRKGQGSKSRGQNQRNKGHGQKDSLEREFASLTVEQHGDDLDDLIDYFRKQKN